MELSERQLRALIRGMVEGVFDGELGSGRATPPPPDVRAQARAKELENSKRITMSAAKKLSPVVSSMRGEIEKMEPDALKKFVYDFGKDTKAVDQKDTQKLAAGVLHMSTKDGRTAPEITDALKKNPKLRAAVMSTPGMMDLQTAVDINMRVAGKDPNRSVGDAWRELGKIASSKGLSERRVRGTRINEARLQQLVRETLLAEAAITPARASELGIRFQVHKGKRDAAIYAYKDGMDDAPVAILEASSKTVDPCAGAWAITYSRSRIDGLGPLMYDLMIDVVSSSPLTSDRGVVSREAKRVWDYYLTRRDDVESIQLDDMYNTLTPEDDDNCMQVSANDPIHGEVDWISSSLSKAYRRRGGGTTTFDELQRLGIIEPSEE